jgi:Ni/Co efflux regulator RcnB
MKLKLMACSALIAAAAAAATPAASAQTPAAAQAQSQERPNLEGFWYSTSVTSLTRPRGVTKLVVTEEEANRIVNRNPLQILSKQDSGVSDLNEDITADKNADRGYNAFWIDPGTTLAKVKGEYRTSWIVDPPSGQIPFKPEAIANRRGPYGGDNFDGPETRPLAERCIMSFSGAAGPVMLNGMYNNTYQIVQAPDHVMILVEMNHDARVIPIKANQAAAEAYLDARPDIPKWAGASAGWYENGALMVVTKDAHPQQRGMITETGKVTERFTRWSDGQVLYEFTVEDPALYSQPWRGEMAWNAAVEPLYEYACHEGNYSFSGILAGAREQERRGIKPSLGPGIFAGIEIPGTSQGE